MSENQDRILVGLKAAAEKRLGGQVRICPDASGVTVRRAASGPEDIPQEDILEQYVWNGAGNMLIRVCYVVWEHIVGEDHEWGRFSTLREAEGRIAALFSPGSLASGEYYVARLFTTKPLE